MADFNVLLFSGGDATSYPDPNTLTTVVPLNPLENGPKDVSQAWITQGKQILVPKGPRLTAYENQIRTLNVAFMPNVAATPLYATRAAITYQVIVWEFSLTAGLWFKKLAAPLSLTGNQVYDLPDPGYGPMYFQLSTISAGTIDCLFSDTAFQKGF